MDFLWILGLIGLIVLVIVIINGVEGSTRGSDGTNFTPRATFKSLFKPANEKAGYFGELRANQYLQTLLTDNDKFMNNLLIPLKTVGRLK